MRNAIVTIDLHGKNCYQAKVAIDAILRKSQGLYQIRIIHGYNHGTALRDFIGAEYSSHPKIKRLDMHDRGVTTLILREI